MSYFFAIEQSVRKPSDAGFTYDLGHGVRPHGALALTETVFADSVILASDAGYCTRPTDPFGPTPYPPRVEEAFAVDAMVNLDPSQSAVGASWGEIDLANNDGKYDPYITGGWVADGHNTRVLWGQKVLENFDGPGSGNTTGGTALDYTNTLRFTGPQVVRQDYGSVVKLDQTATNWVRNSSAVGAIAGTIGSGGAMPTGWSVTMPGLAIDVSTHLSALVSGTANVVRLHVHGTTNGTSGSLSYGTTGSLSGLLNNQAIVQSLYMALAAGSFSHVSQIVHSLVIFDATAASPTVPQVNFISTITATLKRFSRSYTTPTGPAPFATANPSIQFYFAAGAAVDFTIDVAAPQLETGTAPTPFIGTSAGEVTHGDGTVNYIRTSDMSGAVVGNPGTLPTGWTMTLAPGLGRLVVAVGTDPATGYRYIDLRIHGATPNAAPTIDFGTYTDIDATTGQKWCASVYACISGGSQSGLSFQFGVEEIDTNQGFLFFHGDAVGPISTNVINRARRISPGVTQSANTRYLKPSLWINWPANVLHDITIRIMAPQCEGGAIATAFVATSAGPVGRPPTYSVTGAPTLLNEPDAVNYVLAGAIPGAAYTTVAASTDVPPILAGTPVWKHTRLTTSSDNNIGALNVTPPSAGGELHASIWVWVPSSLATKSSIVVDLEGPGLTNGVGGYANLALVDQWQRVTASATLAAGNTYTFVVIRDPPQAGGDVIYTSAWQLELNAVTSFIPPTATPAPRVADGLYTARNILVDPPYASLVPAFNGVAGSLTIDETKLAIPLRDATYWLERPMLRATYGGNGQYDGTLALAGTLKPVVIGGSSVPRLYFPNDWYGPVHNVTPVLVDPPALIYQLSDGAIGRIAAIYEGGYSGGITYAGDVPDLYVGSTPSGQYRSCLTKGCFQLGSTPTRAITCDVNGQLLTSGYDASPLAVASYVLTALCGLPHSLVGSPTLETIGATPPIASGCAVYLGPQDNPSGIDLLTRILAPSGMKLVACRDGKLRALVLAALPDAPQVKVHFDSRNIVSITPIALPAGIDPAPYRIRVGYDENYTVQTTDISPLATADRKQYLATPNSVVQQNSPILSNAIVRPNDPQVIHGSIVDSQYSTGTQAATAAATQYVALWGVRRRVYAIEAPFIVAVGLEYGDVVSITTDIADLSGTKLGQVVGYSYRSEDASIVTRVLV